MAVCEDDNYVYPDAEGNFSRAFKFMPNFCGVFLCLLTRATRDAPAPSLPNVAVATYLAPPVLGFHSENAVRSKYDVVDVASAAELSAVYEVVLIV